MKANLSCEIKLLDLHKVTKSQGDSLIITPFQIKKKDIKLPLLRNKYDSPRRIPEEYQFLDIRSKSFKLSKTPAPYSYKFSRYIISKEFINYALSKVQRKPMVKNLTDLYSRRSEYLSSLENSPIPRSEYKAIPLPKKLTREFIITSSKKKNLILNGLPISLASKLK